MALVGWVGSRIVIIVSGDRSTGIQLWVEVETFATILRHFPITQSDPPVSFTAEQREEFSLSTSTAHQSSFDVNIYEQDGAKRLKGEN